MTTNEIMSKIWENDMNKRQKDHEEEREKRKSYRNDFLHWMDMVTRDIAKAVSTICTNFILDTSNNVENEVDGKHTTKCVEIGAGKITFAIPINSTRIINFYGSSAENFNDFADGITWKILYVHPKVLHIPNNLRKVFRRIIKDEPLITKGAISNDVLSDDIFYEIVVPRISFKQWAITCIERLEKQIRENMSKTFDTIESLSIVVTEINGTDETFTFTCDITIPFNI